MPINIDHNNNSFIIKAANGILTIQTSGALVLPRGNTSNRPSSPQWGSLRFNDQTAKLEVYDGTSWQNIITGTISTIKDTDGNTYVTVEESSNEDTIRFYSSAREIMTITNRGVGIGTSSPFYQLHVSGKGFFSKQIQIGDDNQVKIRITTSSPEAYIVFATSSDKWKIGENENGYFEITDSSGNSLIRMNSTPSNTPTTIKLESDTIIFDSNTTEINSDIKISIGSSVYFLPLSAGKPGQVLTTNGDGGRLFWQTIQTITVNNNDIEQPATTLSGNWTIYSPILLHSEGFNDYARIFYSTDFSSTPYWMGSLYTSPFNINHLLCPLRIEHGLPASLSGNLKYMIHAMSTYVVVTDKGELAAKSRNVFGILGTGDTSARRFFIKIPQSAFDNRKVIKVDLGAGDANYPNRECMLVLVSGGRLYGAGYNNHGALGIGNNNNTVSTFTRAVYLSGLTPIDNIIDFSLSPENTTHNIIIVSATGGYQLYGAGKNNVGQLGAGNTTDYNAFVTCVGIPVSDLVQPPKRVLCAGIVNEANTFVLTYNGKLYHAGSNAYGSSGDGTTTRHDSFVQVNPVSGTETLSAIMIWMPYFKNAFSFVLVDNNGEYELYAAGRNQDGQLGLGDTTNRSSWTKVPLPFDPTADPPRKIIGVGYNSNAVFLLTRNGRVYATGHKARCVIGDNANSNVFLEWRNIKTDGRITDITAHQSVDYYAITQSAVISIDDYLVRASTDAGEIIETGIYSTPDTVKPLPPFIRNRHGRI